MKFHRRIARRLVRPAVTAVAVLVLETITARAIAWNEAADHVLHRNHVVAELAFLFAALALRLAAWFVVPPLMAVAILRAIQTARSTEPSPAPRSE